MTDFETRFVCEKPLEYYIALGAKENGADWLSIDSMITDRPVYAPQGVVAVFSDHGLSLATRFGTPLKLLCLSCFFHHLRKGNRVRFAILDDKYSLSIKPWRAPCATTAIYTENNQTYYLEGCQDTGVFWRRGEEKPRTEPPYILCGAFDANAGCWGASCPHGLYFRDDIDGFTV